MRAYKQKIEKYEYHVVLSRKELVLLQRVCAFSPEVASQVSKASYEYWHPKEMEVKALLDTIFISLKECAEADDAKDQH